MNFRIVTTPLALSVAMVLFCCSHAVAVEHELTEEQAKAFQFLREVMDTDWSYMKNWNKRNEGEKRDEFVKRIEGKSSKIWARERRICQALRVVERLNTPDLDRILAHFAEGWIRIYEIQLWLNYEAGMSRLKISNEIALEAYFRRRMAKLPKEKLLDHLTEWALFYHEGDLPGYTLDARFNGKLARYKQGEQLPRVLGNRSADFIVKHFSAEQVLQAFNRWAQKPRLAEKLNSDYRLRARADSKF